MARSQIRTWLSLDEWSQIIGIDPLGFNQLSSNTYRKNNVCGDVFFQFSWQHADRVGRDDIARAINQAEQEISREIGFNLVPDWTLAERLTYPRPGIPELYNVWGINVRGQMKSVELTKGHVITGGFRAKSVIQAGAAVVRTSEDADAFAEVCTVTVPVSITDTNEIHVYYPGKSGEDAWEIRPITVSISGGNATIRFNIWQIVAANQQEGIVADPISADLANSFETTVDVYRVYNDQTTQVQFLWENDPGCPNCCGSCYACQLGTQNGCLHIRNERLGMVVPAPATWNTSTSQWDSAEWSACREPDQVRFWYYSGFMDPHLSRPYVEMSHELKYAVAVFAASKFERPVCGCSNVNQFIDKWRRDAAYGSQEAGGFTITSELAGNRLGTSMGALYAYRTVQRLRVNK